MKQIKITTLMKLVFLSLIGVWLAWSGGSVNSQTSVPCATCNENYYNCMISIDPSGCADSLVQLCRLLGGDEASCNNGRHIYEQECRNQAEEACQNTYYSCWNNCTINGQPAPPGSAPPPPDISTTCVDPYWTAFVDSAGVVRFTLQNADAQPPPAPGAHLISIDGQQQGSWIYGDWQIPSVYLNGQPHTILVSHNWGCGYYFRGTIVLDTTFTISP